MLHAVTSETKRRDAGSPSPAAANMASRANARRSALVAAQSAYGNQAILRYLSVAQPVSSGVLQRKCACGGSGGDCADCKKKEPELQRKAATPASRASTVPPIVHEVLRSPGQPLDRGTRSAMESSFDHDFSRVRIHDDTQAASSARAVNALAYTVGRNVVFAAGKYAPGTKDGRRLLAHELVHVVQQGSASPSSDIVVGGSGSAHEEEADRVASRMVSGRPATIRQEETPTLQRQVSDGSGGACVTREDIPANVGPLINAGGQVSQRFDMNIDWMNSPDEIRQAGGSYCDCACGEYRQYVKGHLIINGNPESFPLWGGAVLEEDVYHEDAIDRDPDKRYGHRDEPQKNSDKFLADRMSGCSYRGKDAPGVFIGSDIDALFHFKGQTYDACNDIYGPFHEWEFRFKGTLNR